MLRKFSMLVLVALFALAIRAEEKVPDSEGFIRDWVFLAPIALENENAGADEIDKQQIKDEAKIQPKDGEKIKVGDKELAWKKISTKEHYFDVLEILGNTTENSAAYAVCYVVCDDEIKDAELLIGSNDQAKVFLNGTEVLKFSETRTLEKDQNNAEKLTLKKGVNTVVFKVINEMNNWQGCLRFKSGGKPLTKIKVKTEPEQK